MMARSERGTPGFYAGQWCYPGHERGLFYSITPTTPTTPGNYKSYKKEEVINGSLTSCHVSYKVFVNLPGGVCYPGQHTYSSVKPTPANFCTRGSTISKLGFLLRGYPLLGTPVMDLSPCK